MPTITISYEALKQELGKPLSIPELQQGLFDMGMELDGVLDDELTIEVTAERLDLLSLQGIARSLKSFLGVTPTVPKYTTFQGEESYKVIIDDKVKAVRPFTVCAIVKNIVFTQEKIREVINVQEKLHATLGRGRTRGAIGIYPLENIQLPITYTAAPPQEISFIPLGETQELSGAQILSQHETGKEYAHLLEGKAFYPFFVDAKGDILSMPPIINSEKTGRVNMQTSELFIECSGFDKILLHELLTNLTTMFADMGGDIYEMKLEYASEESEITPNLASKRRSFSSKTLEKYIGLKLSLEELKPLLRKMMYEFVNAEYREDGEIILHVTAPPYREDLWHEIDIVEDIVRAYGYNNLPLTFPNISTIGQTLPLSNLREELANVMVGMGFLETYTFGLTSKQEQLTNMLVNEDTVGFIPVANGNETQTMMRLSLLPEELKCFMHNRTQPLPQRIFEGSFVVIPDESKDVKCRNELHFAAAIADKKVTFTQIRQVLESLLLSRNKTPSFKPVHHPSFIKGRSGAVIVNDIVIGIIGEIHPQVLTNFGLVTPVVAFEINLEAL
ncbi:phenylalanine--tRNA ligase subunit beta [Candidatus Woesearchaeota archaeon]|nr:phenylalanine--tRNA ligase subunit beta [Candidatus Woesearchaeota archaeon]